MGTPKDDIWPGVEQLPDYKSSFPNWSAKDLKTAVTGLDDISADLLEVSHTGSGLEAVLLMSSTANAHL